MKKCEKCGAKINKKDTVCPECGAEITVKKKKPVVGIVVTLAVIFILLMSIGLIGGLTAPVRGYYDYNGKPYYYQSGVWYTYSEFGGGSWYAVVPDTAFTDNYKDFYKGNTYTEGSSFEKFEESEYFLADGAVETVGVDTGK